MTHHRTPMLALALAFALAACGKSEPPTPTPTGVPSPATGPAAPPPAPAVQGDPATPLTQYQRLKSGQQLLMAYWAVSSLPVDHERLAEQLFTDYATERDSFKKRDMLKALAPQIDAEIAKAKQNKYYVISVTNRYTSPSEVLAPYDFNRKAFGVQVLRESGLHYFNDHAQYRLGFDNTEPFQWLAVSGEEAARGIETLRTSRNAGALMLDVYFHAGAVELGKTQLKAQIMKIRLLDKDGTVLAEQ